MVRRVTLGAMVAAAAITVAGCARNALEEQATLVMRRTLPPGVAEPYRSNERTGNGFRAAWQFETDMSSSAYTTWLDDSVGPLFRNRRGDSKVLVFSNTFEGDVHTLQVTLAPGAKLNVQAVFTAAPW